MQPAAPQQFLTSPGSATGQPSGLPKAEYCNAN
jgi:hypothetical protein